MCLGTDMSSQLPTMHQVQLAQQCMKEFFSKLQNNSSHFFRGELFSSVGINWFNTETMPLTFWETI